MGGSSSGRYRTRNQGAVEQCLTLDIRQMRRRGYLKPGARLVENWSWLWLPANRPAGSISFIIDLTNDDDLFVELLFSRIGALQRQRVDLIAFPCRFGGHRYYFVCPKTGRHCELLAGIGGVFASREFHRLTYITQSQTRRERLHIKRRKIEARIKGSEGKRCARGSNLARLIDRCEECSEAIDEIFIADTSDWLKRCGNAL